MSWLRSSLCLGLAWAWTCTVVVSCLPLACASFAMLYGGDLLAFSMYSDPQQSAGGPRAVLVTSSVGWRFKQRGLSLSCQRLIAPVGVPGVRLPWSEGPQLPGEGSIYSSCDRAEVSGRFLHRWVRAGLCQGAHAVSTLKSTGAPSCPAFVPELSSPCSLWYLA